MEFYQTAQNRAMQTIAVINEHVPALKVGNTTASGLATLSNGLDATALTRDTTLAAYDGAANQEALNLISLRKLVMALPKVADGELADEIEAEKKLQDLLDPVYAIRPRTTESTLARARKLVPVLTQINAFLGAQIPVRGPITAGGKGVADITALISFFPLLEQNVENTLADATTARSTLFLGARVVHRFNVSFLKKLQAEAIDNPLLTAALGQITTTSVNLPETLSIEDAVQAGENGLHITVSYEPGTGTGATERWVDWMIEGVDPDFTNSTAADLSGNLLGPFTVGQVIKIRTRTINSNGTRTSAIRTITIEALP